MNDEDDILSAEIALGLLDGAEHDAARRRLAADPALAQRVDWWRDRFEPLSGADRVEPSARLWPRIEATLPRNDNTASQVRRWRAAAVAATLVAVVMGSMIALRPAPIQIAPPPATPAATPLLLASLTGEHGVLATIAYNSAADRLTIAPGSIDTSERDAELWIIPAGGTAHSLGTIDPAKPTTAPARADVRRLIGVGATLAITLEQRGGSPTGKATSPVVASGIISGA